MDISPVCAGLSCAAVSDTKPNSIAIARKAVTLFNMFIFTISLL